MIALVVFKQSLSTRNTIAFNVSMITNSPAMYAHKHVFFQSILSLVRHFWWVATKVDIIYYRRVVIVTLSHAHRFVAGVCK